MFDLLLDARFRLFAVGFTSSSCFAGRQTERKGKPNKAKQRTKKEPLSEASGKEPEMKLVPRLKEDWTVIVVSRGQSGQKSSRSCPSPKANERRQTRSAHTHTHTNSILTLLLPTTTVPEKLKKVVAVVAVWLRLHKGGFFAAAGPHFSVHSARRQTSDF